MSFRPHRKLNSIIQVRATNRPIRIVYLVPYEENQVNHRIIDAAFHESYTRWSGGRTLIIPTDTNQFLHEEYLQWLAFYDPDFIYSYVELSNSHLEKINGISCPIAIIKQKERAQVTRWRDYLPDWGTYFNAVSSLSTINSLYAGFPPPWIKKEEHAVPTMVTQYAENDEHRFLPDNFGVALDRFMYPNPVKGRYETLCFTPNELPDRMNVGTNATKSIIEIISKISGNQALPIVRLAMAHSASVPIARPHSWFHQFNLFIGHTCLDRIHFWNARNLCPEPGALIINNEQLQSDDFAKEIGQFLNNRNFIGQHNGPAEVIIRSFSHTREELDSMRIKIAKYTFNRVFLDEGYNRPAFPTNKDFEKNDGTRSTDFTSFQLSGDVNEIQAEEPDHYIFIPARFLSSIHGQWIVEHEIERQNNHSKFSNVIDTWKLPLRQSVARAFTKNLARVSKNHLLAVLPTTDSHPFFGASIKESYKYELILPDDEEFFCWLILENRYLPKEDLRSMLTLTYYKQMSVSDKGQNLRGVISMFDHLSEASDLLTNQYWRTILRSWIGKADTNKLLSSNQLYGFLPNSQESKERLRKELNFGSISDVIKYLKANLTDTLEYLVKKRVFFRVYQWRCSYCGHDNVRTFEDIKETNSCMICEKTHFAPIDIEWKYKLNDFIYRSLCEHNGLTVLWALGQLHGRSYANSFYYLPEIDLFLDYKKKTHEIDLLCVIGGIFYAVEVKRSVIGFIDKDGEVTKFIQKINMIRPDVALLVFEQYCESEDEVERIKKELKKILQYISDKVSTRVKVQTLVASDSPEFRDYPDDLGYYGKRVSKFYDGMEKS
jgi:hypothetical protein